MGTRALGEQAARVDLGLKAAQVSDSQGSMGSLRASPSGACSLPADSLSVDELLVPSSTSEPTISYHNDPVAQLPHRNSLRPRVTMADLRLQRVH